MSMRVVITGASGNVGTSCLSAYAADSRVSEIVAVARRVPQLVFPRTKFVAADVSCDELEPLFRDAHAVVHLAWEIQPSRDEKRLFRNNVEGSVRVFQAAARAGVRHLAYASSIGVYSPADRARLVDESWIAHGIASSIYSMQKVHVERELDAFTARHPDLPVARLRPALIFKREAASEIVRLFLGRLFPVRLLERGRLPAVPERLELQCVHSLDVGRAFRAATLRGANGAFNLAAEPLLDAETIAEVLETRTARISRAVIRTAAAASYRLRLQPSEPGWVDLAFQAPVMSSRRARTELGWAPQHDAVQTFRELVEGMREGAGFPTPPLVPRKSGATGATLSERPA